MTFREKWQTYLETRRGTYGFRAATRYKAVADRLFSLGLSNSSTVLDVGAGSCQFGEYLRGRGFRGLYMPIDAVIDSTDLDEWVCPVGVVDFVVSIEVVEHIRKPMDLVYMMVRAARKGIVLTTPNSEAVDVIACDPTHVSVVPGVILARDGFRVERHSWFGVPNDSLLAWRSLDRQAF
jgi:hypothetical protein